MKISCHRRHSCSGQIMAEACIGLALMAFGWIIINYSTFIANNHLRTAMAARHAAWYKGAGGGDMTGAQLDQYFFYQAGVSKVEYVQGDLPAFFSSDTKSSFPSGAGWPTKAKVTFGVTDINNSANPFPFDLLRTQVPLMPDSALTNAFAVSSECQWDQTSETWRTPGAALSGIFSTLKDMFNPKDLFKKIVGL